MRQVHNVIAVFACVLSYENINAEFRQNGSSSLNIGNIPINFLSYYGLLLWRYGRGFQILNSPTCSSPNSYLRSPWRQRLGAELLAQGAERHPGEGQGKQKERAQKISLEGTQNLKRLFTSFL